MDIDQRAVGQPADRLPTMAESKKAGFRSIICNRPDGEGADQPTFRKSKRPPEEGRDRGRYLPVVSGKVQDEDAEHFGEALIRAAQAGLAYCRTGTRSATLWSLASGRKGHAAADILAATKAGRLRHGRRGAPHRQWRQDADRCRRRIP
jgi:sulfide:quinone oxidoreductase